MSSLWTPDGEHRVTRDREPPRPASEGPPPRGGTAATPSGGGGPQARETGPAGEAGLSDEELETVTGQLLSAPVEDVVANHCYGLFELAALHLSEQPPGLDQARLAIDAMGLVVDGLGSRLGQHAPGLAEGLSQLRMAWVRIAEAATGAPTAEPATGAPTAEPADGDAEARPGGAGTPGEPQSG